MGVVGEEDGRAGEVLLESARCAEADDDALTAAVGKGRSSNIQLKLELVVTPHIISDGRERLARRANGHEALRVRRRAAVRLRARYGDVHYDRLVVRSA